MNIAVKIHINRGTISEFLITNTKLDLKKLIPQAVISYIEGRGDERLTSHKIQLTEKRESAPEYITVFFYAGNRKVMDFLSGIEKNKISTICRSIFEAKFASEKFNFLLENRCFIPENIEPAPEITLESVITAIESGESFKTTIKEFLQLCRQKKRTERFVRDTYKRIENAGGAVTTLSGEEVTEEGFKEMNADTEIVVLRRVVGEVIVAEEGKVENGAEGSEII